MFPSLAASESHDDVASILDLLEDVPQPAPLFPDVSPEHPISAKAREVRDAAARTRAWRERQREAADVNMAIVDALVSVDMAQRVARPLQGIAHYERPIILADVTRLAYEALRRQGYDKARARALLVPRLSPEQQPIAV